MVKVGAGEVLAGVTVAVWIDGFGVGLKLFVADVDSLIGVFAFKKILLVFDNNFAGIEGAVSGEPRWGDAVKHINTQSNC